MMRAGFAVVKKGRDKETGQIVAIKVGLFLSPTITTVTARHAEVVSPVHMFACIMNLLSKPAFKCECCV